MSGVKDTARVLDEEGNLTRDRSFSQVSGYELSARKIDSWNMAAGKIGVYRRS